MLKEIRLDEIATSPTNQRKSFDKARLDELSRSIEQKGVIEPLVVRSRKKGGYEIVAGERRFRAAKLAGLEAVPCVVRELSDVEVLEVQTIENLQREDLHPLEEAAGYEALIKKAGYDVENVAARIGKPTRYVYDRVKLLQLIAPIREVFLAGEVTVGHAILLARLSPKAQAQIFGKGETGGAWRGGDTLFQHESANGHGLDLDDPRKPISVRELAALIDRVVRFRPDEVDLPNLFPETAAALAAAADDDLKVVKITREYRVPDKARDEKERTYGSQSWKRADGEPEPDFHSGKPKPSKTCEHARLGVVVAGPGRGEAFRVCVDKKKCKVHWAAEIRETAKRASEKTSTPKVDHAAERRRWDEQERQRELERSRWKKAAPALLDALAEKVRTTPAIEFVDLLVSELRIAGKRPSHVGRGETLEDAVRFMAFQTLADEVTNEWRAPTSAPAALKPFGINAKKILDAAAPIEKPAKDPAERKKPARKAAKRRKANA